MITKNDDIWKEKRPDTRKKVLFIVLLTVLIATSFFGLIFTNRFVGFVTTMLNASAGTINVLEIQVTHQTGVWQGIYGVARINQYSNDSYQLNAFGGYVNRSDLEFSCLDPDGMDIYFSTKPAAALAVGNVVAASRQDIDGYLGNLTGYWNLTYGTQTFTRNITVLWGNTSITAPGVYTKQLYNESGTDFAEVALKDSSGTLIFGLNTSRWGPGFDGGTYNYQVMVPVPANQTNQTYHMFPDPWCGRVNLSGYVRDNITLDPIANVSIYIAGLLLYTRADGYYSVRIPVNGRFVLTGQKEQYIAHVANITTQTADILYNFTMRRAVVNGSIMGIVRNNRTGQAMQNVTVYAYGETNESDVLGNYSLQVIEGTHTLVGYEPEFDPFIAEVRVTAQNTTFQNISMEPMFGYATGIVRDSSNNQTLANVTVSIYGQSNLTGANGNYSIKVYRGTHNLVAWKLGYNTHAWEIVITGGNTTSHDITLNLSYYVPTNGSITGIVTNNNTGLPLENVSVSIYGQNGLTAANGSYTLNSIPPGHHNLVGTKEGFETYASDVLILANASVGWNFSLSRVARVGENGTLAGTVYDGTTSLPVSGASIETDTVTVYSNSSGRYTMDLPQGQYWVVVQKTGYQTYVRKVNITQFNTTTLNVYLTDVAGISDEEEIIHDVVANDSTLYNFSRNFSIQVNVTLNVGMLQASINLRRYNSTPPGTSVPEFSSLGRYYEFSSNINQSKIVELNYSFGYSESDIPAGFNESLLALYWYNTTARMWEEQNATLMPEQNVILYNQTHFSSYVIGIRRPRLEGSISDSATGRGIDNATMLIGTFRTVSNSAGTYSMSALSGEGFIIVFKDGYDAFVNSTTLAEGVIYPLDIGLDPVVTPGVEEEDEAAIIQTIIRNIKKAKGMAEEKNVSGAKGEEGTGASYYLSVEEIRQVLRLGTYVERTFFIYNFAPSPLNLNFEAEGTVEPYLVLQSSKLRVPPLSRGQFDVKLIGSELGDYTGTIYITGDFEKEVPVELNVTEDVRVDINALVMKLEILQKVVYKGDTLRYKVDLRNLLSQKSFDVTMNVSIEDSKKKQVADLGTQTTNLQTYKTLLGEYQVPKNFRDGEYVMNVEAHYFNFTSTTNSLFVVKTKVMNYLVFGVLPIWLILVFIMFFIMVFMGIMTLRRIQESKKRFHVKIEDKEMPKMGPRSAYAGLIAETTKKAYIDIDKLTVHGVVAGSTGGGKTVSAQVIAEECLLRGVSVIVFDPTAQWSGMLRKLEDKQMLTFYPQYGLKPTDVKAFNGNVKAIKDPREKVSLLNYMKPGEIQIFTLNTLDSKEIDLFVEMTVKDIFRSNLKEARQLNCLLVYDEIHRILPKFGGTGKGFTQIERSCREFRKWGLGVLLISQVLADFVGQIKANINTEIQMKTRDEDDLARLKMKYGEMYVQASVRSPVGTGMVQNSAWNRGKPYYISYRPIMHSVERLSDDELNKYNEYNDLVADLEYQLQQLEELGQDVFDIKLELKLAKDKVKSGNFNMVKIYLDGLIPRIDAMWQKVGHEPKKKDIIYFEDLGLPPKPAAQAAAEQAAKQQASQQVPLPPGPPEQAAGQAAPNAPQAAPNATPPAPAQQPPPPQSIPPS